MSYGLGIDLGTSFTRAAIGGGGRSRMVPLAGGAILMPSVVRVQPDGTLIAGEPDVGDDDPFRTGRDFKRRIGDPSPLILGGQSHSAVSLLAANLRSVVETITTAEDGPPDRVVLTHPAIWDSTRREQFAKIVPLAGLDPAIVTIITEPEAAANHYATRGQLSNGDVVAVHDLGGGTFSTTVTQLTSTGMTILGTPEGIELVGAANLDEIILAHIGQAVDGAFSTLDPRDLAAAIALQRIRAECIRAKERLTRDDATNIPVLLPDRHTQVRLTRTEFEALISPTLEATLTGLHRALRSASIGPEDLTGVLLVGGSSRIPLVARRLSANLGRPVLIDPHPQHCVALGAGAIAGRGLSGTITGRRPNQHHRRRTVIAVTAVAALLAGAGGYVTRDLLSSKNNQESVAAEQIPVPTPITTAAEALPTAAPSQEVTAPLPPKAIRSSPTSTPAPTKTKAKPKAKPKATTVKPKSPTLPLSGTVLGLEGQCLDVINARSENGIGIQSTSCNGTGAQVWNLRTDNTFRALGKCMDVGANNSGEGPSVVLQDCDGTSSQRWRLVNGTIVNQAEKLCLDIVGNNPEDRIPTVLNPCRNDSAQKWKMAAVTVRDTNG